VLIAVRRIGRVHLAIWQIMLGGALVVLVTGQIPPLAAFRAINLDVMLFLAGMFVVGRALEESGYLDHLAYALFRRARSRGALMFLFLLGMGTAAAFLMNDTVAIVGTPIALLLARSHGIPAKVLLLALCYAVTTGSVMSPIGNPQNLLIAVNGQVPNPFLTFARYLFLPTALNLLACYLLLRLFFRDAFRPGALAHAPTPVRDPALARLARASLLLIVTLVLVKIVVVAAWPWVDFRLTYIALAAALPILALSPKRFHILAKIDWKTLVFFAAMFVLMESVWRCGAFQRAIAALPVNLISIPMILVVSVGLSQLLSNVPLVALYLPVLIQAGASTPALIALAAGSTVAGNLAILGAASNVIVIQNAEERSGDTITLLEFARVGVPLSAINVLVYGLFFTVIR
ncbi:anion transporter, partial [Candidatus Bipolaricaulota bacterium]|nr:anion transporter [Candidatus Bipolaricaulota bacterium]